MIIGGHVHIYEKANGFSNRACASLENLLVVTSVLLEMKDC